MKCSGSVQFDSFLQMHLCAVSPNVMENHHHPEQFPDTSSQIWLQTAEETPVLDFFIID